MIKTIIQTARSSKTGLMKGLFGAATVAGAGVGYRINHHKFAHQYGDGPAFMMAGLSAVSFSVAGGLLALEGMYAGGNWAYNKQQLIRRSSWSKAKPQMSGTMNDMRMLSIQNLSRAGGSRTRVMGNEAFYLHR